MMSTNGKNKTKLSIDRLSFLLMFRGSKRPLTASLPAPQVANDRARRLAADQIGFTRDVTGAPR
jgi:hypothetical protein